MQTQLISCTRCIPENMCINRYLKIESHCKHYADFNTNRNQILLYGKQHYFICAKCNFRVFDIFDYFTKNKVVNSKLTYFHQYSMKTISIRKIPFL